MSLYSKMVRFLITMSLLSLAAAGCGSGEIALAPTEGGITDGGGGTGVTPITPPDGGTTGGATGGAPGGTTGGMTTGGTDIGTPPRRLEPVDCRVPTPLDNYVGLFHCIEGYCRDSYTGDRVECPYGIPEDRPAPTVTCRAWETVDNFPGYYHCIEGNCQDSAGASIDCPFSIPSGVPPLPAPTTCRAWEPVMGAEDVYHCIEGYCVDTASNTSRDCPAF